MNQKVLIVTDKTKNYINKGEYLIFSNQMKIAEQKKSK